VSFVTSCVSVLLVGVSSIVNIVGDSDFGDNKRQGLNKVRSDNNRMDLELLERKFCGTMLGVLAGDCLGAPYEEKTMYDGDKIILQQFLDKIEENSLATG